MTDTYVAFGLVFSFLVIAALILHFGVKDLLRVQQEGTSMDTEAVAPIELTANDRWRLNSALTLLLSAEHTLADLALRDEALLRAALLTSDAVRLTRARLNAARGTPQ